MNQEPNQKKSFSSYFYTGLFIVPTLLFAGMAAFLLFTSNRIANDDTIDLTIEPLYNLITQWLDPLFFQYNLALLVFSIVIVPLITYFYVHSMGPEKRRRLKRELPTEDYNNKETEDHIENYLEKTFALRNYLGSMVVLMIVIMFGCSIILLFKPMPLDSTGVFGVDYSKGANFLMLGTYMQFYMQGKTDEYIYILINTLTAFQFGFLGAYVYFIGHLVRSYFTLDLTPNFFVSCSVRMMTGSLLALVLCFFFVKPTDLTEINGMLPVWSFFIGFFPSRGLTLIENVSVKALGLMHIREFATPLSDLPGMHYNHEIRLNREGFDNIENLANANVLDLALRTGFSYQQLSQWVGQARLHGYLRNDYHFFVKCTGITTLDDFIDYFLAVKAQSPADDPADTLIAATSTDEHSFNEKIRILSKIAVARNPNHVTVTVPLATTHTANDTKNESTK